MALCFSLQQQQGKIVVLGSTYMFSDAYIDKEENSKILDVIFRFLTSDEVQLDDIDAADPEVTNGLLLLMKLKFLY